MPISKTQRFLDLIAFLAGRRYPVGVDQLMEAVPAYAEKWVDGSDTERASVRRAFERDKDELRELGIPLETVRFRIDRSDEESQGYRLSRTDFYLPYLTLLKDEAPAQPAPRGSLTFVAEDIAPLAQGLFHVAEMPSSPFAADARSALRKLSFDLVPSWSGDLAPPPIAFAEPAGADDIRERTEVLSDALLRRKRVRFRYAGMNRAQVTSRDVAGYGLLFKHGHWYLIGHDALRDAVRVFRVSRMSDVSVNAARANSPDYEIPEGFDLSAYRERQPWELGGEDDLEIEARVRFAFPRSLWAERNGLGEAVEPAPDGSAVRRFRVRQPGPFVRWLLSFQGEAEVVAPAELARELKRVAAEVAALYQGDGSKDDGRPRHATAPTRRPE